MSSCKSSAVYAHELQTTTHDAQGRKESAYGLESVALKVLQRSSRLIRPLGSVVAGSGWLSAGELLSDERPAKCIQDVFGITADDCLAHRPLDHVEWHARSRVKASKSSVRSSDD